MLRIQKLGHRGDGIAEGGNSFVPFTLPGESVDPGPPLRILQPAAERETPSCPHFGTCGGCALQHANDAFLAGWKADLVAQALAARGLQAPIRPTHVSGPGSRRRVVLAGRRTRKGTIVGFHGRADAALVSIQSCSVADPRLVAALPFCAELTARVASRKAEVRLALTVAQAGLDIDVSGAQPLDRALRADLATFAAQAGLARLSYGGEVVAMLTPPLQQMGTARVLPPPGSFLQATPQGEAALVAAIAEALQGASSVADLFSGCGTFALPLAITAPVHAVESDGAALQALDTAARATPGLYPISIERRDLFRRPLLASEFKPFDAAVIDPPRAGAEAQARALASSPLKRLASISCNPATFARDARILVDGGWRLDWVQPVDQFRWSPHVELAAAFSRAG